MSDLTDLDALADQLRHVATLLDGTPTVSGTGLRSIADQLDQWSDLIDAAAATHAAKDALLGEVVADVNGANAPDMLDGYLNDMAAEYNDRLSALGMATFDVVGED